MPTTRGSSPAEWMKLTSQLVDAGTVSADFNGFAAVALRWRHEQDAATQRQASATVLQCSQPHHGSEHGQRRANAVLAVAGHDRARPTLQNPTFTGACPQDDAGIRPH